MKIFTDYFSVLFNFLFCFMFKITIIMFIKKDVSGFTDGKLYIYILNQLLKMSVSALWWRLGMALDLLHTTAPNGNWTRVDQHGDSPARWSRCADSGSWDSCSHWTQTPQGCNPPLPHLAAHASHNGCTQCPRARSHGNHLLSGPQRSHDALVSWPLFTPQGAEELSR